MHLIAYDTFPLRENSLRFESYFNIYREGHIDNFHENFRNKYISMYNSFLSLILFRFILGFEQFKSYSIRHGEMTIRKTSKLEHFWFKICQRDREISAAHIGSTFHATPRAAHWAGGKERKWSGTSLFQVSRAWKAIFVFKTINKDHVLCSQIRSLMNQCV